MTEKDIEEAVKSLISKKDVTHKLVQKSRTNI